MKCRKAGLNEKVACCGMLPLRLTRVSSGAELIISLCEDITAYGEATVDVNVAYDAITVE